MSHGNTAESGAPSAVERLASAMPEDIHVVYRHATVPYLMITDGLRVMFAVYIDDSCLQDGHRDVWYTRNAQVAPLHLVGAMEDWVEGKIGKGFPCAVVCWMPAGSTKATLAKDVFIGSADKVGNAFVERLMAQPVFQAEASNLKALIGIAIEGWHRRAPALLARLLGQEPEEALAREVAVQAIGEVQGTVDADGSPRPAVLVDGDKAEVVLFDWTGRSTSQDNPSVRDLRKRMCEPMRLAGPRDHDRIDEIAAELFAESPWTRDAILALAEDMKAAVDEGRRWLSFKPVILLGPSGCGKSWLARRLGELAGAGVGGFDASSTTSLGPYVGVDSVWRGAMPSVAVSTIARVGIANPIVVVDEVDKAGRSEDASNPAESLLPVLERSTAGKFWDTYLSGPVDLSYVNWILTANTLSRVPEPLRDRCRVVRIERPSGEEMEAFVRRACERRDLDEEVAEMVLDGLDDVANPSLRSIVRAVEAADRASRRPMVH